MSETICKICNNYIENQKRNYEFNVTECKSFDINRTMPTIIRNSFVSLRMSGKTKSCEFFKKIRTKP